MGRFGKKVAQAQTGGVSAFGPLDTSFAARVRMVSYDDLKLRPAYDADIRNIHVVRWLKSASLTSVITYGRFFGSVRCGYSEYPRRMQA